MSRFGGSSRHALLEMLLAEVDREPLLRAIAQAAGREVDADRVTAYAVDRMRNVLSGLVAMGIEGRPIELPLTTDSIAGFCALTGRSLRIDDVSGDLSHVDPELRFSKRTAETLGYETRSMAVVPVRARGAVIGVLQALNARGGAFSAEDIERLEEFAALAGLALHVSGLYEDIKSLREIDRRKSEFMDLLVHEIKEPVAAIQMMAQYVLELAEDADERRRLLERIGVRSAQVTRLIGELLEVSRVKRGHVLGEVRPVHLGEVVRAAVQGLSDFAERRGVTVGVHIEPNVPPVRLDDALAPCLVTNLLNNALKYTDGGGRADVALRRETGGVLLEVTDRGIGVPPGEIRRLFQEFYRASNARARGVDGTGLGLVAVKGIAERFGGRVGVESEIGRGSRFWVWLPPYDE